MEWGFVACLLLLSAFPLLLWAGGKAMPWQERERQARLGADGVQEVEIVVRGGYRPRTVVVRRGRPVRLLFNRQEDISCSEKVVFSDFQQERRLPPHTTTAVQFIPTRVGEFLFTCAEGMYQGRLIVMSDE